MSGRRAVGWLAAACAAAAAAAAVLGTLGAGGWLARAGVAAAVAVVTLTAGIARDRLARRLQSRDDARAALAGSVYMPGTGLPLVRAVTDPAAAGVRGAGHGPCPPYVPRDADAVLRPALAAGGFTLLVGEAAAGKTRTAYEAVRAALPGHVFVAPAGPGDVAAAVTAARAARHSVLWLDSLQRYLGPGGLTSKAVAELAADAGPRHVVVATLRAAEESRVLAGGSLMRDAQAILDQARHRIPVGRLFSAAERASAARLAAADPRLAEALRHADRYGIAEYLSSGPQLRLEWDDAWERGAHPRGAALVAAAVDCRRAGFAAPLPRALLDELEPAYLAGRGGASLRPEPAQEAWEWATRLRDAGTSPLWPVAPDRFEVFDYLVEAAAGPGDLAPDATVRAALRFAGPADAEVMGATAWFQGRRALAELALRQARDMLARAPAPDLEAVLSCRTNLAVVLDAMDKLPEAENEFRGIRDAWLDRAGPDAEQTLASRNNLAVVLHRSGKLAQAAAEYRAVCQARAAALGDEDPATLVSRNNLAVVLADMGLLDEAEAEHRAVLAIRRRVLGDRHPHTAISRDNLDRVLRRKGRA